MKKIIIIAVIAVVLIVAGVLVFVLVLNKPKEEVKKPVVYSEFQLEEMYSNIATPGKILKTKVSIQYTNPELLEELESKKSKIVNDINKLFRTKTYEQLSEKNGQTRVQEEILELVKETIEAEAEEITDVFFLDFIIQ